jgi:predicted NodU family carbamoyl transferase
MSSILGLNAYHADSAACLLVDGKLVAAAEEERFRRVKHWAGLPTKAIDYCLSEARLNLSEVDHIAINRKPGINNLRRLAFVATQWPSPKLVMEKIKNIRSAVSTKETLEQTYKVELKAQFHQVEHHLAHLASAFLVSDFAEAACLSVDGFGDFASTAFGFGSGQELTISKRIYFPHSLGIFYSALTQYLGFPHYGDEYKVMGLAPYGEPNLLDPLREVVRIQSDGTFRLNLDYFRHHSDNVSYTWNDCTPSVGLLYKSTLIDLLGPARAPNEPLEQKHKDLARSVQVTYEKAFFALLHALHKQHPCSNLALAGGCAMNSVANGKVYRRTPFTQMYLPAAAGDAGGAIGAAAYVLSQLKEERGQRSEVPSSPGYDVASGDQKRKDELVSSGPGEVGAIDPNRLAEQENIQQSEVPSPRGYDVASSEPKRGDELVSSNADQPGPESAGASIGATLAEVEATSAEAEPRNQRKSREDYWGFSARRPIENSSEMEEAKKPPNEHISPASVSERDNANDEVRVAETASLPEQSAIRNPQSEIPSVPLRPLNSAYLGPESTEIEIHALIDWKKNEIQFAGCALSYIGVEEELTKQTAQAIADGKVIGWFQGRMEWGPRALGNRSILADPRRADMKDILNTKIKRRESFRPFAPSILREAVSEWFEQDDDVPFMMEVFQIRAQKRSFIPAVTHVDGSGRLQTVHKETNPRYYRLIEQFRELTGIPMVLNTSFNENEPVVCYPEEALDCFLRTKMDVLVLGNFWIQRHA